MGNYLPISQRERELLSRVDGLIRERDDFKPPSLTLTLKGEYKVSNYKRDRRLGHSSKQQTNKMSVV